MVMTPLVVLFLNSFKTSAEANKMALSLPPKWVFENYATESRFRPFFTA